MTSAAPALGHVLVTGGAGFIGCALSQILAAQADSWTAVDNLHPQVHPTGERPELLHEAARLVVGDVTEPQTWAQLGQLRPTTVIHLAAETGTGQSLTEASRHGLVNVVGTTRLTDWLGQVGHRPDHLLLSSSRAVYGEGAWKAADGSIWYPGQRSHDMLARGEWDFPGSIATPARADRTQPQPTSVYGATKLAQEHILAAWCLSQGVPLSIFRLQNVYGPGQSLTNTYTGIVTLFSRLAKSGQSIPVYEDGDIVRDFVFIDDVAGALAAGLAQPPTAHRTLDVGTGVSTTIAGLAAELADLYAAPAPHVNGKFRDGDVRYALADIGQTVASVPWTPQIDLRTGLTRLGAWIDEQGEQ